MKHFEIERLAWIIGVNLIYESLQEGGRRKSVGKDEVTEPTGKRCVRKGPQTSECEWSLEAEKGKEKASCLVSPKRSAVLSELDCSPVEICVRLWTTRSMRE